MSAHGNAARAGQRSGRAETTGPRLVFLALLVAILLVVLLGRLWFLQVMAADRYVNLAEGNSVRTITTQAPRGNVYDRSGELLVGNRYALVVSVQPREMGKRTDEILGELARLLDVEVKEIRQRVEESRVSALRPKPVAVDVPEDIAFYLHENRGNRFPGVYVETLPRRTHPQGDVASHVLGYVGEVTGEELDQPEFRGYRPGDLVGRAGVERSYESVLRGEEGVRRLEVNASNEVVGTLEETLPTPGSDVRLTLDAEAQKLAEDALSEGIERARRTRDREQGEHRGGTFEAPAGAVVVLDPDNGAVVAMASYPDYDPAAFVGGISSEEWKALSDPEGAFPLINRAVAATYPPGSVFKIVSAAAALQHGFMNPGDRLDCPARWEWEGQVFHNWKLTDSGQMGLATALTESCDTVFYELAREMWKQEQSSGAKHEFLTEQAQAWGFDQKTGIDLPNERSGVVPGREWRREYWKEHRDTYCAKARRLEEGSHAQQVNKELCERGDRWRGGDAVNLSIGQGDLQSTPLQVANSFAALANGGTLYRPHVAKEIVHRDGTVEEVEPEVLGEVPLSDEQLDYIETGLRGVTDPERDGTAGGVFAGFPVTIAGKTGTAEMPPKQPFAWFVGYNPDADEGSDYVVAAMLEEGGGGSQTAAPIVRRVFEGLYGLESLVEQPLGPGPETE